MIEYSLTYRSPRLDVTVRTPEGEEPEELESGYPLGALLADLLPRVNEEACIEPLLSLAEAAMEYAGCHVDSFSPFGFDWEELGNANKNDKRVMGAYRGFVAAAKELVAAFDEATLR